MCATGGGVEHVSEQSPPPPLPPPLVFVSWTQNIVAASVAEKQDAAMKLKVLTRQATFRMELLSPLVPKDMLHALAQTLVDDEDTAHIIAAVFMNLTFNKELESSHLARMGLGGFSNMLLRASLTPLDEQGKRFHSDTYALVCVSRMTPVCLAPTPCPSVRTCACSAGRGATRRGLASLTPLTTMTLGVAEHRV